MEDLYLFYDLKPDANNRLHPDDIRRAIKEHEKFVLERFEIQDASGQALEGRIVQVKPFEIPPDGVPMGELMSHAVVYELEYQPGGPPEFLTFTQNMADELAGIPSEMQLRLKQAGAPTPTYTVLRPGQPFTVRFSWDNPPLSPDASEEEWRKWMERQEQETLGITSYSSVYSFLYIEDFEVRHEILIPLLTLEESVLIPRNDDDVLDLSEQQEAREQVAAWFTAGNPVRIDGIEVKPIVQRVDFYGLDFKDFAMMAEPRDVPLASARVGVILAYSTKGPPRKVELTWDRFNQYIWDVNGRIYAYDEVRQHTFSRLDPPSHTFVWTTDKVRVLPKVEALAVSRAAPSQGHGPRLAVVALVVCLMAAAAALLRWSPRPVRIPAVAAFLLAAVACQWWYFRNGSVVKANPTPTQEQARAIFEALQRNVYRAFDYRKEEDIYDALARSVHGRILQQLYLQIQKSLKMQEQGGAVSRIQEVRLVEGQAQPLEDHAPGFLFSCRWNVTGTVEHWGHIHQRTNQYQARFRVEAVEGVWKITDVQLLDQKRIDFQTRVRKL